MDRMTKIRAQWDRAAAAACTGLGALFLLVGWFGTSGTPSVAKQLPYMISGGLGGIFLLTVGGVLWLSADLRDQWRELRNLRVLREAEVERAALESARAEELAQWEAPEVEVALPVQAQVTRTRRRGPVGSGRQSA